VVRKHLI